MNTGPGSVGVHSSSGESCKQIHKNHTMVKLYKLPFIHCHIRLSSCSTSKPQQVVRTHRIITKQPHSTFGKQANAVLVPILPSQYTGLHFAVSREILVLVLEQAISHVKNGILAASRFPLQIQVLLTACSRITEL